jgi:two-component system nitrogen regulation response regulator NtrX
MFSGTKLLFVDDEQDILDNFEDIFSGTAEKIFQATSGLEALDILRTQAIDAVVVDICMPKMDGLELLEKVRQFNVTIPFIVVTGFGDKENAVRALRLGAFDFIDKPIKVDVLQNRIQAALEVSRQMKSLQYLVKNVFTQLIKPGDGPANSNR